MQIGWEEHSFTAELLIKEMLPSSLCSATLGFGEFRGGKAGQMFGPGFAYQFAR